MTHVRFVRDYSPYAEGEIAEVDADEAGQLITLAIARPVSSDEELDRLRQGPPVRVVMRASYGLNTLGEVCLLPAPLAKKLEADGIVEILEGVAELAEGQ